MREKRRGIGFETVAAAWGGYIVETLSITTELSILRNAVCLGGAVFMYVWSSHIAKYGSKG